MNYVTGLGLRIFEDPFSFSLDYSNKNFILSHNPITVPHSVSNGLWYTALKYGSEHMFFQVFLELMN
jgi:hypothetical protein